jgi:hypothetical protein
MGAGAVVRGAETAGTGIAGGVEISGAGGETKLPRAVMTSAVITPPAIATHPAATSGLVQRCWWLAWRRRSSQGSVRGCTGIAVGESGNSGSAALGAALGIAVEAAARGAAASAPIRSRSERNSSIVKIWSGSDSSTTPYNEVLEP